MKVYFVRHGESVANARLIHQGASERLSVKGIQQSKLLAQRLKGVAIDIILTSDYDRAKQTAEIISKTLNKKIVSSSLLRERRTPKEIHGHHIDDPQIATIKQLIDKSMTNPYYRYSNEETFYDLKARAVKIIRLLQNYKVNNLLVVLHGSILRYVLCQMMFGKDYNWDTYLTFSRFVKTDNTGITICELDKEKWRLLTLNDHWHIKDL